MATYAGTEIHYVYSQKPSFPAKIQSINLRNAGHGGTRL